ncbi:MAG TPA: hypothetical protein DCX54_12900 [Flavobacteriales bacterium]|nr:hypothetical protein [Flavobacteriales bacterium]
MFGLLKPKSEIEKLEKKYEQLLGKSHKLSTVNRSKSDAAYAQAHEILETISKLKNT